MNNELRDKRILLTGGSGFLGSVVRERLEEASPAAIFAPRRRDYDLRRRDAIDAAMDEFRPDVVIHLAASVGGIGANRQNAGTYFYDNAIMAIELMESSRVHEVEKFVGVGTICSYPKFAPVPFREDEIWSGYPEETNAPYGLAKKMMLVQGQAYRQQYGFNAIHLLPVNLYGPGDNFDPRSSHVIPALIRKIFEAKERGERALVVWGTGNATREFLHVRDAARGIVLAAKTYNGSEPLNLGTGIERPIRELVELLTELCEFQGEIVWDHSKPDGQPRRCLDTSRAKQEIGFEAEIDFRQGLEETIEWYLRHRDAIDRTAAESVTH